MNALVKMLGMATLSLALFSACTPSTPYAGVPTSVDPPPVAPVTPVTPVGPLESPFTQTPNPAACQPGVLKASSKTAVVDWVNRLRALHGLSPVVYDFSLEGGTQAAALMMLTNNQLSHTPPSNWVCYSSDGATAASKTNLSRGMVTGEVSSVPNSQPTAMLGGFFTELNSRNASGNIDIGHRRWLLNPFLRQISVGWVDARSTNQYSYAGTLRVIDESDFEVPTSSKVDFVAYPQGDYPAEAFDPATRLSFSVLVNKSSLWQNDSSRVDLSGAQVEMTPALALNTLQATVLNTQDPNSAGTEGLPNVLEWNAPGMQRGVTYTVKVKGVKIKTDSAWQTKEYQYSFKGS